MPGKKFWGPNNLTLSLLTIVRIMILYYVIELPLGICDRFQRENLMMTKIKKTIALNRCPKSLFLSQFKMKKKIKLSP